MLSLKKYFTEGLIQFTILLSLVGVRVDVDSYLSSQLPPLREIILGPSSAYAQTQFHHLRGTWAGHAVHPKSVQLDSFFTSRRLLSQVRALDRLRVPSTELSAWLVHRDPEGAVPGGQQDGAAGDGGVRDGAAEQGFGDELEDLGAVAAPGNADLTKEVGIWGFLDRFLVLFFSVFWPPRPAELWIFSRGCRNPGFWCSGAPSGVIFPFCQLQRSGERRGKELGGPS